MEQTKPRKSNIAMTMFYYWSILVLWQWVRPVANRSLIDILVKVGMFAILIIYAQKHERKVKESKWMLWMALFFSTQMVTLLFDSGERSTGSVISFAFIFVQIFVFLVLLSDEVTYELEIEQFCKFIMIIVLFMAVYNLIVQRNDVLATFSSGGSRYGHESSSILYSNHEFGIYLANGIIVAFWMALRGKLKYWQMFILVAIYGINLLATSSRTAILGCVAAVFILLFFYKKSVFFVILGIFVIGMVIIYVNPTTKAIIFDKILKGTFENGQIMDEGRSNMYDDEWGAFTSAGAFKQFFGYGYSGASIFPGHNGYIMILLTGGISMLIFFVAIIMVGLKYSIKTVMVNKSLGSLMLGFQVFALLYMIAQTAILFYSTMDSFFITMTAILLPKYVYNYEVLGYGREQEQEETANENHST